MEFLDILKEGKRYQRDVFSLYQEAFPPEEKKPEELLLMLAGQGKMELLAVVEKGEFVGLMMNMLTPKTALLDYFAIASDKRNGGYGSRAIRKMLERFRGKKYIFEIEMQDESADNALERKRRKAFYLRNGLKETGIFANVYQTDFELLAPDGCLTYEEYVAMLETILGEEGVRFLNPRLLEKSRGF